MSEQKEEYQSKPVTKKEAYLTVGMAALMVASALVVPFVALFAAVMLAVPVLMDVSKHGKSNILNNSWKDLKQAWHIVKSDLGQKFAREQRHGAPGAQKRAQVEDIAPAPLPAKNTASTEFNDRVAEEKPAADTTCQPQGRPSPHEAPRQK